MSFTVTPEHLAAIAGRTTALMAARQWQRDDLRGKLPTG